MLRQVVVTHGSNVYIAGCKKRHRGHRVHHLKLFNVLSDRNNPFFIIKVIMNWYSKMFVSVPIKSGVLQGSILFPILFNLYVDVIIDALSKIGYGCFCMQD